MLLRDAGREVEAKIECVEVPPATAGRLLADCAVHDQRDFLFRQAAVRAQRYVEPGEVVPAAAGADDRVEPRDHHEIADPVCGQLEARRRIRAGQHRLDARDRGDPAGERAVVSGVGR